MSPNLNWRNTCRFSDEFAGGTFYNELIAFGHALCELQRAWFVLWFFGLITGSLFCHPLAMQKTILMIINDKVRILRK